MGRTGRAGVKHLAVHHQHRHRQPARIDGRHLWRQARHEGAAAQHLGRPPAMKPASQTQEPRRGEGRRRSGSQTRSVQADAFHIPAANSAPGPAAPPTQRPALGSQPQVPLAAPPANTPPLGSHAAEIHLRPGCPLLPAAASVQPQANRTRPAHRRRSAGGWVHRRLTLIWGRTCGESVVKGRGVAVPVERSPLLARCGVVHEDDAVHLQSGAQAGGRCTQLTALDRSHMSCGETAR